MFLLCFELTIFTEQTYANNINKDGGQRYVYIEHPPLSEKLKINLPPQKKSGIFTSPRNQLGIFS